MLVNIFRNPSAIFYVASTKYKNTAEGSATSVYTALLPGVVGGGYYCDCQLETKHVHPLNDDVEAAKKLWDVSVELAAKAGVDVTKP